MNWRWMMNRLVAMPPGEIAYRTRLALRAKSLKRRLDEISGTPPESLLPDAFVLPEDGNTADPYEVRLLRHLRQRTSPRFFFDYREREQIARTIAERYPDEMQMLRRSADRLAMRKFPLFGREVDLGDPIDWHLDHITGRSWPKAFALDIDTRSADEIGGIKYTWEPSRHLHWMTLGRAFFLTGDEKYARELCAQWESWLDDNPPMIGVHWAVGLEMAVRIFCWTWSLNFLLPWEGLDEKLVARALGSMLLQLRFIPEHFALYSSANNHLIGEASALAFGAILFPEFKEARHWREIGLKVLSEEITRQVHPDGVTAEQASSYETFVLDFYLQSFLSATNNGIVTRPEIAPNLERMLEFLGSILPAGGLLPLIGDADDGQALRLAEGLEGNACSLLATGAALFEREDFAAWSGGFDEKSWWYLGEAGWERFHQLGASSKPRESRAFEDGGYYVMRSGEGDHERLMVTDCGPLGYLSIAAHGHADCLSVILSLGGYPVLVDPGNYCYHEWPEWRTYFKSTGAHNTLLVDGQDQSEMRGPGLWGRRAKAELLRWESNETYDYFHGQHDGYRALTPPVIHTRRVLYLKPDTWVIVDSLGGEGKHRWERRFHFSPGEVEIDPSSRCVTATRGGHRLAMVWPEEDPVNLACGCEDPILGWYAPSYGVKKPACCVSIAGEGEVPARRATVLAAGEIPRVRWLPGRQGQLALALEYPSASQTILFNGLRGIQVQCEERASRG